MSTGAWASCLDDFADHLAYQREALAAGTPDLIVPFVPSAALGPLPLGLLERARALQAQADGLTAAISEARSRTQAMIADLHRSSGPATPSFVDNRL